MNDRVALAIVTTDGRTIDALRTRLADLDGYRSTLLRRPVRERNVVSIANIGTGNVVHRHDIHTSLVPLDDEVVEPAASPMQAAGLCPRTFRDSGVPFFWDRLASRGVSSVTLGFPFAAIGDDSPLVEYPFPAIFRGVKNRPQRMLAAFEKLDELVPDYRFAAGWLPLRSATKPFDDDEPIDGDDGAGEGDVNAAGSGDDLERVLAFVSEFKERIDVDHHVVVLHGPRYGHLLVGGRRSDETVAESVLEIDVAPTVLDLLGEEMSSFIRGRSALKAASPIDSAVGGSATWEIDDVPIVSKDMQRLVEGIRGSDDHPMRVKVATAYLQSRFWSSMSDGFVDQALAAAREMARIAPSDLHLFWLALSSAMGRDVEQRDGAVASLRSGYPDSNATRMIPLLPGMGTDEETVRAVLDDVDPSSGLSPILRGLWGRTAVRRGLLDRGIETLQTLFKAGYAIRADRVVLGDAYSRRNAEGDPKRVLQCTATIAGVSRPVHGDVNPRVLLLRSLALSRIGMKDEAISMLERCLEDFPMEPRVTAMLAELRGPAGGS